MTIKFLDANVRDRIILMAFHNLSYLLPSKVSTKKKTWTPSIPDSTDAFVQIVKNSNSMVARMKAQKSISDEYGIAYHPTILEVQNSKTNDYFVGICETIYDSTSFIAAVDGAFKLFVMLNIPFPPQCSKFWLFLNQIFYKLDLPQKPNYKMVSVLNSFTLDN